MYVLFCMVALRFRTERLNMKKPLSLEDWNRLSQHRLPNLSPSLLSVVFRFHCFLLIDEKWSHYWYPYALTDMAKEGKTQQGCPPIDTPHIQRRKSISTASFIHSSHFNKHEVFGALGEGQGKNEFSKMWELQQQKSACSISHCLET